METELKLSTSPAHLQQISAQRLLQDVATRAPGTHHLISHYFDTPPRAARAVQGLMRKGGR